jgi:hypothetical protein
LIKALIESNLAEDIRCAYPSWGIEALLKRFVHKILGLFQRIQHVSFALPSGVDPDVPCLDTPKIKKVLTNINVIKVVC